MRIRKLFNQKIVSFLIVGVFVFNSPLYGSSLARKTCLRVPISAATNRLKEGAVQKIDWQEAMHGWRVKYESLRGQIRATQGLDAKLALIRQIHTTMVEEEIQKIKAIERAEREINGGLSYTRFSAKAIVWEDMFPDKEEGHELPLWDEDDAPFGFEDELVSMSEVDPSLYEEPLWDEKEINRYYYHGTSLGILRVWANLGQMGGVPGLTRELDIDKTGANGIYFDSIDMYREEYENIPPLIGVLEQTTKYATRTSRPARAVLTYYIFRALWEREGYKEPFPPFSDFLQRVILRTPKEDVRGSSGDADLAQFGTQQAVSTERVELLLSDDIPLPTPPVEWMGSLSDLDPENLSARDSWVAFDEAERLRLYKLQASFYPELKIHSTGGAIGNRVIGKWQSIQILLPRSAPVEGAGSKLSPGPRDNI